MSTRKKSNFKKYVAAVINIQLLLSPLAIAQDKSTVANNVLMTTNALSKLTQDAASQYMQRMQEMATQQRAAQMQQELAIVPVDPQQVPAPLANCTVLPANFNKLTQEASCEEFDQQEGAGGMWAMYGTVASQHVSTLEGFLTEGHERFTSQGGTCYDQAMKNYKQLLDQKIQGLIAKKQEYAERLKNFEKNTTNKENFKNLMTGEALLTGKPAEYLKSNKFETFFKDAQCLSFVDTNTFKKKGSAGGYNSILSMIEDETSKTSQDGGLTPARFLGGYQDMEGDIKRIAIAAEKQILEQQSLSVDLSALNVKTNILDKANPSLQSVASDIEGRLASEVEGDEKQIKKIIGDDQKAMGILAYIKDDTVNIDTAISNYERESKNACLESYLQSNFGGIAGIRQKLFDPNVSDKANEQADSAFKNYIESVLADSQLSAEEKLSRIKTEEAQDNNSRYKMTTGRSISINGTKIGASTGVNASGIIGLLVKNCVDRFESAETSSGKSQRQIVQALKSHQAKIETQRKQFAAQVRDGIIQDMLTCSTDQTTGVGANSCNGKLSMSSKNFCLRTAKTCAENMNSCQNKAQTIVDKTKEEQRVVAEAYQTEVVRFKTNLHSDLQNLIGTLTMDMVSSDASLALGTTFNPPTGLLFSTENGTDFLRKDVNKELMIEDPEQYLKMADKDLDTLIKAATEHTDKLYKGVEAEKNKYMANYDKQMAYWKGIVNSCTGMINEYNRAQQESYAKATEAANEKNQEMSGLCNRLDAFNDNPIAGCGDVSELSEDISRLVIAPGDSLGTLGAYKGICQAFQSSSDDGTTNMLGGQGYNVPGIGKDKDGLCHVDPDKDDTYIDRFTNIKSYCDVYHGSDDANLCSKDKLKKYFCSNSNSGIISVKEKDGECTGSLQDLEAASEIKNEHREELVSERGDELREDLECSISDSGLASSKKERKDAKENLEKLAQQVAASDESNEMGDVKVSDCSSLDNSQQSMKGPFGNLLGQQNSANPSWGSNATGF